MAAMETRGRILDQAEMLFAERGYDGASLREITASAGVQLAMVNYHFQSKQGLWHHVFARRTEALGAERLSLLGDCEAAAAPGPPAIETIIDAFVRPLIHFSTSGEPGWKHYVKLVAQTANSAHPEARRITRLFDPVARRFIAAFHRALPEYDEQEIVYRFTFLLGAVLHTFAETRRVECLTDGRVRSDDVERIGEHLVSFLAAGFGDGPTRS